MKTGINPVKNLDATLKTDRFFNIPSEDSAYENLPANPQWIENECYFGWHSRKLNGFPKWHRNPFNGSRTESAEKDWWELPDFDSQLGDIKTVWETSRFDWVISLAQNAAKGDERSLETLNRWLINWCEQNPPFKGPNWKCGQEASIRVLHLAIAAKILKQDTTSTDSLRQLVSTLLKRILPTIGYAMAQDNNHGTSEAAALFVGGSWLLNLGDPDGREYRTTGRKWLENRAVHLVEPDGSFSQHSVNYHRVMLDTFSIAEYWRKTNGLPQFSDKLLPSARRRSRLALSTNRTQHG